jgi:hypothetical protein
MGGVEMQQSRTAILQARGHEQVLAVIAVAGVDTLFPDQQLCSLPNRCDAV